MIDSFLRLGADPVIPVGIGVLIYIWAASGYWMALGRPYMGGMWACYALANACMIMDTLQLQGKL